MLRVKVWLEFPNLDETDRDSVMENINDTDFNVPDYNYIVGSGFVKVIKAEV
jgi:hypothetical protein